MKDLSLKSNFNLKHQVYLFYLIPLLFLIGRAPVDIVFTYLAVNFFFDKIIFKKDYSIFTNKIFQIGLIFCIIQIFISFFSIDFVKSFLKSLSYLRFIFFWGATVYFLKSSYFRLNYFYYVIAISLFLINFDILIQYLFGYDLFGYEPVKNGFNSFRYSGFFGDEFIAGNYVQKFLLIFSVLTILKSNEFYKKYILEIFVLFSILIILITGERMALINTFYSFIFIFIFIKKIRFYLLIVGTIFLLSATSVLYYDQGVRDRVLTIPKQLLNKQNNYFYNPHLNLFKQSIQIFNNNKMFGTGIKTFRKSCSMKQNSVSIKGLDSLINTNFCSNHPHNYYFELLSETGLVGFLSFLILVIMLLYYTGYNNSFLNNQKLSFLSLAVFLFPIASSGSFFTNMNACYFWFFISLVNIKLKNYKRDNGVSRMKRK